MMAQGQGGVVPLLYSFVVVMVLGAGVMAIGDVNHDRPYLDLPGMPITLKTSQNEQDCASMFSQNEKENKYRSDKEI
jgi:hypothetical protein